MAVMLTPWAPARAAQSCTVGQRVIIPGGQAGTVVDKQGSACVVKPDGATYTDTWAPPMISPIRPSDVPADLPPAAGVDLGPGSYQCYYLAGTVLNYSFIDVIIIDAGNYADRNGAIGRYHRAGREIVFDSGPLAGYPAYGENGNVYLTAPAGGFYMTCSPGR